MSPTPRARYPDLSGKTVFVTGGGSGIGAAIVCAFAAQGARVGFVDILQAESEALVRSLDPAGSRVRYLRCDIRDIAALQAAMARLAEELGDIGVLVNNAADDGRHASEQVTPEEWDQRIAVNLRPTFFTCQAVLPQMKRLGGGSVINLSSIVAKIKALPLPVYVAAKTAIHGLTRSFAREYGPAGIRVNTVSPGQVRTERQVRLWHTPETKTQVFHDQCLAEWVLPEHVADLVLFLASDASARITAQELVIDGGWS